MAAADLAFPTVDVASDSDDDYLVSTFRPRRRAASATVPSASDANKRSNKESDVPSNVKPGSFRALGLSDGVCTALSKAGYGYPTSVQKRAIPAVLAGRDVVVMARTGAGKTAAFLAPLIDRLQSRPSLARANGPRVLILAPTRELAIQTHKFLRLYTRGSETPPPRAAVLVGGTPLDAQFEALAVCPDVLVATPGRCLQLLAEMGRSRAALTIATAETVVFDEADRLFEGTLAAETAAILKQIERPAVGTDPSHRQTVLVSATMPSALVEFSRTGLRANVEVVRMDAHHALPPTLAVAFVSTRGRDDKDAALLITLRRALDVNASVLVFAATHRAVEYIVALVHHTLRTPVDSVHGNMDQGARVEAVARFRKRSSNILVVTDVAARGIDLPDLDIVLNYDFPATPKLFVHRVGRAARAGRPGRALSFVTADEAPFMFDTHLFLARGVQLANNEQTDDGGEEAWRNIELALQSSFLFGDVPKAPLDEEVEMLRRTVDDVDIDKLRTSAKNAHGLYVRTRSVASGESVKRAKELFRDDDGGRIRLCVHPWFADMESELENQASILASQVSSWRPKESAVPIPSSLRERKRKRDELKKMTNAADLVADADHDELAVKSDRGTLDISSHQSKAILAEMHTVQPKRTKKRTRQLAMEKQRQEFFVPLQRNSTNASSVGHVDPSMDDGFGAFRAIQSAAMDLNADTNVDLLRNKHIGAHQGKYWDRVSKKFVKGGVTDATSKRNLHVTTKEAKAKARGELDYSLGDGVMYRKWLNKNKKAVDAKREALESGDSLPTTTDGIGGGNDFRRGAYGRRARVIAASRTKKMGGGVSGSAAGAKDELKSANEIKKERKMKRKAELRRLAKDERKRRGKAAAKGRATGGGPRTAAGVASSRSSKVRVIARGQKRR